MKVGTQQGNHQLGKSTKVLTDQGHPIDNITFIVSTLNPPYLLLHLSLILMMAVKENQSISSQVRGASSNVKDQCLDEETLDIFSEINSSNLVSTNTGTAISSQLTEVAKRYWEEESRKSQVVSKIAERLLIPNHCEFVRVPKLNEAVAKN